MSDLAPHAASEAVERVLIIPHCWDCGEGVQMLLSAAGYQAEVVRGGDAAVRRALEVRPQAVLVDLDLTLTGDDGRAVGWRLRAALGSRVQLIALRGAGWKGDLPEWREAGFDGWLPKPVSAEQLLQLFPRLQGA